LTIYKTLQSEGGEFYKLHYLKNEFRYRFQIFIKMCVFGWTSKCVNFKNYILKRIEVMEDYKTLQSV